MKKVNKIMIMGAAIMSISSLAGCTSSELEGFTKIEYEQQERERYDNIFRENIPEQWDTYGIGDPYLLRYNGEYYLFVSTKDNNPGYKVWKSRDLLHFEYLGHKGIFNSDGTTSNQLGQYAPEIYYWNGDFYMVGSPAGHGHHIYKSIDGTPFGDYYSVTGNFGLSIDGSIFIDDDESMYFYSATNGGINAYRMNSITSVDPSSVTKLNASLVNWTEGPCLIKHNGSYFLTYTGNHVKSPGYRIDYAYATNGPMGDYNMPSNSTIALNSLKGKQTGLGHSSTVLGPNLDSYYISYHSLDNASGPIRSYNINRMSFTDNRMNMYGPVEKGTQVAMMPDFINYDGENHMVVIDNAILSPAMSHSRFSSEYNFKNISNISTLKLYFGIEESATLNNYITIENKQICLYVDNVKVGEGSLKNDFDYEHLHTVRMQHEAGHYTIYFDNMKKIDVNAPAVDGGFVGYGGVDQSQIGATSFSNDAYDSSDKREAKIIPGDFHVDKYLDEVSNVGDNTLKPIESDDFDYDGIYTGASSLKLSKKGQYLTYAIDVLEDGLYGIEALYSQASAGSRISIQVDNNAPFCFEVKKQDFSSNMDGFEADLQYIKTCLAEILITKGLHTLKFELISGQADFVYFNVFKDSKYAPDYFNDLSTYQPTGINYLSLWKIFDDNGTKVHKALSGVNSMALFGSEEMTNYVVEVDIKMTINAAASSQTGLIVRCNNPSLYSGQSAYSAQGYMITFDRMQLMLNRIDYNNIISAVTTGDFTLDEYHHIKVICLDNKITVFYDGEEFFSYRDPNPFSHGLVALYSVNCESLFKNLSIKGII